LPVFWFLACASIAPETDVAVVCDHTVVNATVTIDIGKADTILGSFAGLDASDVFEGRGCVATTVAQVK
jgi:hypothetical protein